MTEADVQKDVQKAEKENANPVIRTMNLSSKVRTRMYSRAMRDFHNLQRRSKETIDSMTFTVDLVGFTEMLTAQIYPLCTATQNSGLENEDC